jgi:hypothetical protein
MTPVKATAQPANSQRGKPSARKMPARMAIRIGPVLITIAAVPASTRRSAALSVKL